MYKKTISAVLAVFLIFSCWINAPACVSAGTSSIQYPVTASVTRGGVPLKLRSRATTASSILAEIPRGSSITITGKYNSYWYTASYNGKKGYVYAKYIIMPSSDSSSNTGTSSGNNMDYPVTGTVTKGGVPLKLRSRATTASSILAEIPRGSSITITGKYNSYWYTAYYNGKNGYVYSKYVILPDNSSSGSDGTSSENAPTYKYNPVRLSVPYYWQYDSGWVNLRIGNSNNTIKTDGCVICGLAGIESYRTGTTITPIDELEKQSFTSTGAIYWPAGTAAYYGSDYLEVIYKQLQAKNPVLIGGRSSSGQQHWVLVTGYAGQGNTLRASDFLINDSCYKEHSRLSEYQSLYPNFYKIVYFK